MLKWLATELVTPTLTLCFYDYIDASMHVQYIDNRILSSKYED